MSHMTQATILTFNLSDADNARMRNLAQGLDIRLKAVPPESFTLPLGAMLGIPVDPSRATTQRGGFSEPMLLMCNFTESQFNDFLRLARGPGLPQIALKAVLTPHNVGWNALQLHEELRSEHEAMTRARKKP